MSFRRILIAVDGSTTSCVAARVGFELAATLSAEVRTINAVEAPVPYSDQIGIAPEELLEVASRNANIVLDALRRTVHIPERTSHLVRVGHPADVIMQVAKDWPADLIVIGSHGRSGVARVLLGSVAESVVRHACCPVLVIRQDDRQTK